jgi:hypothetical protein
MSGWRRRGGKELHKVDLDGYEEYAARQEQQVAAKARRSRNEPKREKIECRRSSGSFAQPCSPDTTGDVETASLL